MQPGHWSDGETILLVFVVGGGLIMLVSCVRLAFKAARALQNQRVMGRRMASEERWRRDHDPFYDRDKRDEEIAKALNTAYQGRSEDRTPRPVVSRSTRMDEVETPQPVHRRPSDGR